MEYAYDSMLQAQKKVMALQKKQLNIDRGNMDKHVKKEQDIGSIISDMDILENDINMTTRDLDEYMSYRGNSIRNIPSLHNISPLSRKILYALKKLDLKEVPENQMRDLRGSRTKVKDAWQKLKDSVDDLNHILHNGPRPKDDPFRYLYGIAEVDYMSLITYIRDHLKNVGGHNYFTGSGIPKRFL